MWCNNCKKIVEEEECPNCNEKTQEDIPADVYWCDECKVPVIKEITSVTKNICPVCKSKLRYMSVDLRPVFPEERLLFEVLKNKPLQHVEESVWAINNKYYLNGVPKTLSRSEMQNANINDLIDKLEYYRTHDTDRTFNAIINKFVQANRERLNQLKDEAYKFIQQSRINYGNEQIVVSFSGGKDSTVVSDLVTRALNNPSIVHIFGDTTLEFPLTIEYAERFHRDNPQTIFKTAINKDQDFYSVCSDIGPPSRVMRWCCTMFKTGPITRVINRTLRDKSIILTFYGIRKSESVSRSKYHRIYKEEKDKDKIKIQKQVVASPIFYWKDIDIWLYILGENIDFNHAYRLGYDRVGCWCCPNNSERSHFLSKIYMPNEANRWRNFLIDFAKRIGKPDPEVYVDNGKWKARQGGYGVQAAEDIKIEYTNCTTEENAKIYKLNKPTTDEFYNLFVPFGIVSKELGRRLIGEVLVLDCKSKVPIISIQPFKSDGYEVSVKIQTMNVRHHDDLQRMISYQIRKFNACRKCLKCESVCKVGAISVNNHSYKIDESKCVRCRMCVTYKYLEGGCLMNKFLFSASTKEE